jgi:hypothetical protein
MKMEDGASACFAILHLPFSHFPLAFPKNCGRLFVAGISRQKAVVGRQSKQQNALLPSGC